MVGELIIRWTARVCAACYVVALAQRDDSRRRGWWTAAYLLLVVHVLAAFHFVHHWSHAAALAQTVEETAAVTGWRFGGGVYFNYALLVVWGADVLAVWLQVPRPKWLRAAVQAFVAFMMLNATIVFEAGPLRWWALGAVGALAVLWVARARIRR